MKKIFFRFVLITAATLVTFAILFFRPINRTPIENTRSFHNTFQYVDAFLPKIYLPEEQLEAGWSRQNLMPDYKTPIAGYRPRGQYEIVHDSLFVNCLLLNNGNTKIALLSYDLLIVPPAVKDKIKKSIAENELPVQFAFMSASHTHNGIGGWDHSPAGQFIAGEYDSKLVDYIYQQTLVAIESAGTNSQKCQLSFIEANAQSFVKNRVDQNSKKDGYVRGLEIIDQNGKKGILYSFSAHATNISSKSKAISNDYPGNMNRKFEDGFYNFAMYMAGTVGSHSVSQSGKGFEFIEQYSEELNEHILSNMNKESEDDSLNIEFGSIPINFDFSQLRMSDNLRLGNLLFKYAFSPLEGNIEYLRIGNVLMLGMPCDFSGELAVQNELYRYASQKGLNLIITSFNGDYVGYITADHHYDHAAHFEVRNMNWVGPQYGHFFTTIIKKIIDKS